MGIDSPVRILFICAQFFWISLENDFHYIVCQGALLLLKFEIEDIIPVDEGDGFACAQQ